MSEQLKFYKGLEEDLPISNIEIGALYHCEDTGNTYRGISENEMILFSTVNQPLQTIVFTFTNFDEPWVFDSSSFTMQSHYLALGKFTAYKIDDDGDLQEVSPSDHKFYQAIDQNTGRAYALHTTNDLGGAPAQFFDIPHLIYFSNSNIYVLDSIPYLPLEGITVKSGHTADAHYLYHAEDYANNLDQNKVTPILIGVMKNYEGTSNNITAFINREKPIEANLEYGTISAPGGMSTYGENDNWGNNQNILYSNQGIFYFDLDNSQDYYIYFNPSEIKIYDGYNGMKCLQMNTSGGETFLNGSIATSGSIESQTNLYANSNVYSQGYRLPRVYYGTSEPDDNDGEDGDIYIMYS